jgi:hypothetical protein
VFAITDHSGNRRTDIAILAIEVRADIISLDRLEQLTHSITLHAKP